MKKRIASIFVMLFAICALTFSGVTNGFYISAAAADEEATQSLEYSVVDGKAQITGIGTVKGSKLVIPETIDGYEVESIANSAFEDNLDIIRVTLASSVKTIGRRAFYGCLNLVSIAADETETVGDAAFTNTAWFDAQPEGIVYVGKACYQFKGEAEIGKVVVRDGIKTISDYAFRDQINIRSVELPETIETIGNYAFVYCSGIETINLPASLKSIGNGAFQNCNALNIESFPESIEKVGANAFGGTAWYSTLPNGVAYVGKALYTYKGEMPQNTEIEIANGTLSISQNAFSSCDGLSKVTFPDTLKSIGANAFKGCSALNEIYIPNSVEEISDAAFSQCQLKNVELGDGLTYIPSTLISESLEKINIPSSVTKIEASTFEGCYLLEEIVIPDSVKEIGSKAFFYCLNLSKITVPDSVELIGADAFKDTAWFDTQDDGLVYVGSVAYKYKGEMPKKTEIVLRDGTVSVSNYAFNLCQGLDKIVIPDSVKTIARNAFVSCGVKEVVMGDGLKEIPGCLVSDSLVKIVVGSSVKTIPASRFKNCQNLETVIFKNGLETIETEAFKNCLLIKEIVLPDTVSSVTYDAFYGCKLEKVVMSNSLETIPYSLASRTVESFVIGNSVKNLEDSIFENCTQLKEIAIPDSVVSIGEKAFKGCSSLSKITIGKGVESIGKDCFDGCDKAESMVIFDIASWCMIDFENAKSNPMSAAKKIYLADKEIKELVIPTVLRDEEEWLVNISDYAFYGCEEITAVDFSGAATIGKSAFENCKSLSKIETTDSVISISQNAFKNCENASSLVLGNRVETVEDEAFANCKKLTSLIIPDSVTSIGKDAFLACPIESVKMGTGLETIPAAIISGELKYFVVGSNISEIPAFAFRNCTKLETIVMGENVKKIAQSAFNNCSSLNNVKIPSGVTTLETSVFSGCSSLSNIDFGDIERFTFVGANALNGTAWLNAQENGVVYIGSNAYKYKGVVPKHTVLTVKDGTKKISPEAFINCLGIEEVTIADSVVEIGEGAFNGCSDLINVTINGNVKTIAKDTFKGCSNLYQIVLMSDVESVEKYAFDGCTKLEKIYFGGTKDQFEEISIADGNAEFENAIVFYNYNLSCSHKYSVSVYKEATCTKSGTDKYTCVNCGQFYFKEVEATGHFLSDEWIVYKEATCNQTGEKRCYCQNGCGHYERATIEKTEHFDYDGDRKCDFCDKDIIDQLCDCSCHKTGFSAIIHKIKLIFWKLLKIKPVCECGAAHY